MSVTLTDEQFALLWTYLDREYRVVSDPRYVGETIKIGEKLWAMVREVGAEQGFSPPSGSTADDDAVRPSAWAPPSRSGPKSQSSSRPTK